MTIQVTFNSFTNIHRIYVLKQSKIASRIKDAGVKCNHFIKNRVVQRRRTTLTWNSCAPTPMSINLAPNGHEMECITDAMLYMFH